MAISVKYLDKLWSKCIMKRANYRCEICEFLGFRYRNMNKRLNSHHILTKKSFPGLRWDLENGVNLCVTHHIFGKFSAHSDPGWFEKIILKYKEDEEFYNKLRLKGNTTFKVDRKLTKMLLKEYLND